MFSLYRKEINTFLGSLTGYLVIFIFLIATSLFLWVIPGNFNIIDNGQSSLKGFFELAPWIYLFLIPAITMRLFAEEKRMGTIELLLTRPLNSLQIVFSKYLAALTLVIISLIPTLIYYFTVYQLGNPVGNIDTGGTWGSFIGLLFLASIYIALGIFASSLSGNQIIAFLLALLLSYFFYLGFNYGALLPIPSGFSTLTEQLGIDAHYKSISRGVLDSRDIIYFLLATTIFLTITSLKISTNKSNQQKKIGGIVAMVLLLIIFNQTYLFRIDLTSEKRYSLTETTHNYLNEFEEPIYFEIYLDGDLPAEMKTFQQAIIEKIEDIKSYSKAKIYYQHFNVYEITDNEERTNIINNLIDAGVQPVNFGHKTTEGLSTKQIFPGIIIQSKGKGVAVNLLQNNPAVSPQENLKHSIELLEYNFTNVFKQLLQNNKPTIAFLTGHGEANEYETADIRYALNENFQLTAIKASALNQSDSISTLIIADPVQVFSESDKLQIDQFLMRGGKLLWCVDPVQTNIDSLSNGYTTLAYGKDLHLRDQLFKYGVRLNPDLVQDAFCAQYPINTAPKGQNAKFTAAPFYYTPLSQPSKQHLLSRNLNNVLTEFISSIDDVGNNKQVQKTPILTSSPYARKITTPVEINLLSATTPPDQHLFNQSQIPLGYALEGTFESVFKNRMITGLGYPFKDFRDQSIPTKMIVIADGGIIKNKYRTQNGQIQIQPAGFDRYSGMTFGNKEFLINCIDYLNDGTGIMNLRSRVLQLRMLDKVKIREEQLKWQLINTISPLLFFGIFGFFFNWFRRKKYRKSINS